VTLLTKKRPSSHTRGIVVGSRAVRGIGCPISVSIFMTIHTSSAKAKKGRLNTHTTHSIIEGIERCIEKSVEMVGSIQVKSIKQCLQ
jgi:hypothetical protein